MGTDDDRVAVKVHLPRWQKQRWVENADELNMTQSEFIRSMVQAGRREIVVSGGDPETHSGDGNPGGNDLEERVLAVLRESSEHLGWDALVSGVTDDVEDRLEDCLERLQETNRIKYSGRNGGYTLTNVERQ
ncbi:DUF5805 domain-containing protein [Halocatena halophila]|uniref:DUF5805 domain-containing protein n=1 Tax=Halocatena halophila TaxID=2814576 RepID=UPI002ED2CB7A